MASDLDFLSVSKTGVSVATSATATVVAPLPTDGSGNVPRYIRIAATTPACVKIGASGMTVATTGDMQIQPGDAEIVATQGATHYSAIQVSSAGIVQISPLDNI